ncbi:MAG: hypothetical protein JW867_05730 [Candidatus Omnitrophica bacterium]|nr:hypothetical protein [Candidatus Omnitrophota bacterium]
MHRGFRWLNALAEKANFGFNQTEINNQLRNIYSKYANLQYFVLGGFLLYFLILMNIVMRGVKYASSLKDKAVVLLKAIIINTVFFLGIVLFKKGLPDNSIAESINNIMGKISLTDTMLFAGLSAGVIIAFVWGLLAGATDSKKFEDKAFTKEKK